MSWKSLVCAGLLCALAAMPAMAQPSMAVAGDPTMNTAGNLVWTIEVTPDATLAAAGNGAVAVEVGFTAPYLGLVGTTTNTTDWDHENAGVSPFAWTFTDGVETSGNEVMAALGSVVFPDGTPSTMITIETSDPWYVDASNYSLTTRIEATGAYGGNGRIAQGGVDNDTVAFANQYYVRPGDANLDGSVGGLDYLLWKAAPNTTWAGGDFNDDGSVGGLDYLIWKGAPNPGAGPPVGSHPGAGAGAIVGAVPEPSSLVLLVLGLVLAAARRARS
jgi:hypothetical protein